MDAAGTIFSQSFDFVEIVSGSDISFKSIGQRKQVFRQ
jgi:hypothetical protein